MGRYANKKVERSFASFKDDPVSFAIYPLGFLLRMKLDVALLEHAKNSLTHDRPGGRQGPRFRSINGYLCFVTFLAAPEYRVHQEGRLVGSSRARKRRGAAYDNNTATIKLFKGFPQLNGPGSII